MVGIGNARSIGILDEAVDAMVDTMVDRLLRRVGVCSATEGNGREKWRTVR